MKKSLLFYLFSLLFLLPFFGCGIELGSGKGSFSNTEENGSLADARKGFETKLLDRGYAREPVEEPPADVFRVVKYDSPVGQLPAYLTLDPRDGKKHPAIVWITGGDCNTIGDVWSPAPAENDQTARAYRDAGIVMMFPSLRGGNENPGRKDGFFHEIDDVLAAADFLAKQDFVDPQRIYLGGHSTGGTMSLLTAEISPRFRAVFSFGPVTDVSCYPSEYVPFDATIRRECELRNAALWLHCIESPVFVFEGAQEGNYECLKELSRVSKNPKAHFLPVNDADHFSLLAPVNRLIARKILADNGPACNISFTTEEVDRAR